MRLPMILFYSESARRCPIRASCFKQFRDLVRGRAVNVLPDLSEARGQLAPDQAASGEGGFQLFDRADAEKVAAETHAGQGAVLRGKDSSTDP